MSMPLHQLNPLNVSEGGVNLFPGYAQWFYNLAPVLDNPPQLLPPLPHGFPGRVGEQAEAIAIATPIYQAPRYVIGGPVQQ